MSYRRRPDLVSIHGEDDLRARDPAWLLLLTLVFLLGVGLLFIFYVKPF